MLLALQLNNLLAGASTAPVPDVVGDSQAVATATLEADDFVVAAFNTYSPSVPVGDVVSQSPIAGATAAIGSTVTIFVSIGPAPGGGSDIDSLFGTSSLFGNNGLFSTDGLF